MKIIKYMIGVKRANSEKWQYAEEVSINARFVNADFGKKFDTIDAAKKWWGWSSPYFHEYETKKAYFDWNTLSIVKYIVEQEIIETL